MHDVLVSKCVYALVSKRVYALVSRPSPGLGEDVPPGSVDLLLASALWVAAAVALSRRWPVDRAPDSVGRVLATAAVFGAVAVGVCDWLSDSVAMGSAPYIASDFDQYCAAVEAVRSGLSEGLPANRGRAGAWLPALFARQLGIIEGLHLTACLGQGAVFAGLFVWSRTLWGRGAGAAAVVIGCACWPLTVLGRTLTFYPGIVASAVWCAAAAVLAWRYRSAGTIVALGVTVGVALLADVRGMLFVAGPLLVGFMLVLQAERRQLPWMLLALGVPIAVSWGLARAWVPSGAPGLEQQALQMLGEVSARAGQPVEQVDLQDDITIAVLHEFLWGWRGLVHLPGSFGRVVSIQAELRQLPPLSDLRFQLLAPWLVPALVGGLVALLHHLRKGALRVVLAGVLVVPFAVSVHSSASWIAHPRYLAVGAPALVLGLSALVGCGVDRFRRKLSARQERQRSLGSVLVPVGVFIVGLLLLLLPASRGMSARAEWRGMIITDSEPSATLAAVQRGSSDQYQRNPICIAGLQADLAHQ